MSPSITFEDLLDTHGVVAGVDEAGRGPLAGPVFAAAVVVTREQLETLNRLPLRDSKKLTPRKREELYEKITSTLTCASGMCSVATIDRINILQATFLAMKKSLDALRKQPNFVIVDGIQPIPNLSLPQISLARADETVPLVSAASIIAKVQRDRLMTELSRHYPHYEFDRHKWYGTAIHLRHLEKYGPCPLHRTSFAPIRKLLPFTKSE